MTVSLAGRAPATFEIKSANLPLVALLLKSSDLRLLAQELQDRFGDIPDFFDHDPLVIDLSGVGDSKVDFEALLRTIRPYRVMPVAVKGGTSQQMEAALRAGLAAAPEAALTPVPSQRPATPSPQLPPAPASALIIDKPLRSGQQVYARGRDVVVLAMVNAGAEVIADGHVHVYAPLRGKAVAGARGYSDARILTLCLEPELVSIAGVYRTTEQPLPAAVRGKPAQIRLVDDQLVMEPLNS
jgi:septum site-determining protein MinC